MDALERLRTIRDQSADPHNPGPEALRQIMESVHTVAVVGISGNPEKPARRIPAYLAAKGYDVIPVNPFLDEVLGKRARSSLAEVTEPVDMVLVFRPSQEAGTVMETAMEREERPVIWLQEGIQADEVAARARARGLTVVQDLCAYKVHKAL
jgi:uncharacterized protein